MFSFFFRARQVEKKKVSIPKSPCRRARESPLARIRVPEQAHARALQSQVGSGAIKVLTTKQLLSKRRQGGGRKSQRVPPTAKNRKGRGGSRSIGAAPSLELSMLLSASSLHPSCGQRALLRSDDREREAERGALLGSSVHFSLSSPSPNCRRRRPLPLSLSFFRRRRKKSDAAREARMLFFAFAASSPLAEALAYLLGPRLLGLGDIDSGQGGHEVADVAQGAVEFCF